MANGKTAIVFPGQGSQRHGMGKDFYESIPECRRIYEQASDALGWDVAALCFGEDEKLNLTAYAQPSIVVTEIAMLKAIIDKYGITPDVFGGHSLGEYTALVAAGVLPLETVLRIVHIRGSLMQEAVPVGEGSIEEFEAAGGCREGGGAEELGEGVADAGLLVDDAAEDVGVDEEDVGHRQEGRQAGAQLGAGGRAGGADAEETIEQARQQGLGALGWRGGAHAALL